MGPNRQPITSPKPDRAALEFIDRIAYLTDVDEAIRSEFYPNGGNFGPKCISVFR